jgi:hypothetical protein
MPFGLRRNKSDAPQQPPIDDDYAPGWDALDAVFAAAYPGQTPDHWKPNDVPLPAQDGVWGISGYRDEGSWLYVTYGLTDLFDLFKKPGPGEVDPDAVVWSGFGFELTMRVRSDEPTPPLWPVELLSKLGKYVYQTKAGFEHGQRLDPRGPITGGTPPTALMALAFVEDPVLQAFDTPLGRVEFITVVGITSDELARMNASSTDAVVDELRQQSPQLVTDPSRTN